MPQNQCHYSWRRDNGEWVRCVHEKGTDHGDRHHAPDPHSWVAVWAELDIPHHRWVA